MTKISRPEKNKQEGRKKPEAVGWKKAKTRGQWMGPQARHEEEAWQGHVDDE